MEVRPNTFMISADFWGRTLNLFLLRGDMLFLIDTGIAGMPGELIFPYMRERGLACEELQLIANTHAHADHLGGNAEALAGCPSARLAVHELDRPWVEDHALLCRELYEPYSDLGLFSSESSELMRKVCGENSPVDVTWRGGEIIDLGGLKLEVVHAPGHSPGNLVFLDRQAGVLYEGESILGGETGQPGNLGVPYYCDVVSYRASMCHLDELPWDLLLSSHSAPRDGAAGRQAIKESLDFVDRFGEQMTTVLALFKGPATLAEIMQAMHDRYGYAADLGLALLLDTHLAYESRAKRAVQEADGRWNAAG